MKLTAENLVKQSPKRLAQAERMRGAGENCPGGEQVQPDLEDVYLYYFQEKSGEGSK